MTLPDCTSYPPLQPNPDVSGKGVLAGFLVPPFLTLALCVVQYLLDKERSSDLDEAVKVKTRQILALVARCFRAEFDLSSKSSEHWISAIEGAILAFSDQQVITGVSILISGFSQLRSGISSYHWQSVVNLAWLSSVTHLITLTSLRRQARGNSPFRWWRIIAMGIMAAMLIGAIIPVGFLTSEQAHIPYSFPAWCLYHPRTDWGGFVFPIYNGFYVFLIVLILVGSYIRRVYTLFPSDGKPSPIVSSLRKYFEGTLSTLEDLEPQHIALKIMALAAYSSVRSSYTVLVSGYRLFGSRLWELTFALTWGTIRVFMSRQGYRGVYVPDEATLEDVLAQEGVWGFAQVIAVLLLALPVVGFYEAYFFPPPHIEDFQIPPIRESDATPILGGPDGIYNQAWYPKLLILWYGLALAFGGDLLYIFPYSGPDSLDLGNRGFGLILRYYLIWLALDIGILWVPTVFLIDPIIQYIWLETWVGRKMSDKPWSPIVWGLLLATLMFVSVYFDILSYSNPDLA